jgi:hypothetical protein
MNFTAYILSFDMSDEQLSVLGTNVAELSRRLVAACKNDALPNFEADQEPLFLDFVAAITPGEDFTQTARAIWLRFINHQTPHQQNELLSEILAKSLEISALVRLVKPALECDPPTEMGRVAALGAMAEALTVFASTAPSNPLFDALMHTATYRLENVVTKFARPISCATQRPHQLH